MKIYIDDGYRCKTENSGDKYREFDVPFFDGRCQAFVEGYQYIPKGENWTRDDGTIFKGEMIAPWKSYAELAAAQAEYERNRDTIEQLQAAVVDAEEAQAAYEEGVQLA